MEVSGHFKALLNADESDNYNSALNWTVTVQFNSALNEDVSEQLNCALNGDLSGQLPVSSLQLDLAEFLSTAGLCIFPQYLKRESRKATYDSTPQPSQYGCC